MELVSIQGHKKEAWSGFTCIFYKFKELELSKLPPNLYIIGAPKAGTSSLVSDLSKIDGIFVPKIKELKYFDAHVFFDREADYPIKSYDEYLSHYSSRDAQESVYRVDGSVFNMYSQRAIKNILNVSPDSKFIIIVRDPVSSVKSMYLQRMKYTINSMREESNIFSDCWEKIDARKNGQGYPEGCRNKFLFRYDLLYSYEKYIPF